MTLFVWGKLTLGLKLYRRKRMRTCRKWRLSWQRTLCRSIFLTPMRIIRDAILGVGSPAPIVVSEGANTMDVGRSVLVQTEPRTRLHAGTWGTMGVGLGYCIAAALASPDRLVVAVEGDSGFGFSAMEVELLHQNVTPCISARRSVRYSVSEKLFPCPLRDGGCELRNVSICLIAQTLMSRFAAARKQLTLVRYQLLVVVIVFNNGGVYSGNRRSPEEITGPFKDDPAPTSFVPGAAYHFLIEAFGGEGYLFGTLDELKSALTESFAARKPAVINVTIDPYAGAENGRLQHKN
ncbi:hypothetical protein RHSIM_Rhsim10G0074000 [Rhododendron simsii]|uniref:2-hydroxyacyl-CoA lyase n=1 Tax=Rhododendron simsii TaxID=118357 RepID=A0A834GBA8_RHOSS|nr:hypothetical protein RHSIM_Rhsim10G0074000 [Rhododendron simsii]